MSALIESLARVQRLREVRDELAAALKSTREAFEATIAADALVLKKWNEELAAAESETKALALVAYTADPTNKQPADGVTIKVMTVLSYDSAKALAWAQDTKLCLSPESLDEASFKKIASATSLAFVTKKEEPQAQIASKLNVVVAAVAA